MYKLYTTHTHTHTHTHIHTHIFFIPDNMDSFSKQIWKTQQRQQDWRVSSHSIPKKGNAMECSNYCKIALISHASKVMLKILQARLQQYMNWELLDVQARLRKGRETKDQNGNICWITEIAREFQKEKKKKDLLLLYWLHQCLWWCGS